MRNWAGNYAFGARRLHEPRSVAEIQEIVRAASNLRVLGSRHSFNAIADTGGDLISLAALPRVIEIDRRGETVTIDGGIRYGDVSAALHAAGGALHNLASLPHISVAGACATGTHGSGDGHGNLSTAVQAMDVVRGDGEIETIDGGRADDLAGAAVSLGALGVVTRLTLRTQPTTLVRQDVYEDLPVDAFVDQFEELASAADSVSFFTEWGERPVIDQVWLKRRVVPGDPYEPPGELHGAIRATIERHPIRRMSAEACTPQLGVPGPWYERLPHFRMDHMPSSGAEIQSEYFVGRGDAMAAFVALLALREKLAGLIQVSEIRTIAADDLWLSPASGRPTVAFHFTWQPDADAVNAILPLVERALGPYQPRPHWGKAFTMAPSEVRAGYPRLPAFVRLARRLDPAGTFRNDFLRQYLFADSD
jgi:xylitol oxidase